MTDRRWRTRSFRFVVSASVLLGSASCVAPPAPVASTVVSLTFDDGQASQYSTKPMLSSRGMAGTYYINSAMVGSSRYYMQWPEIDELANAGNEIGGHTLHHANLTKVGAAKAKTEVCDDRTNLIEYGFTPMVSFAYPEAASDAAAQHIVRNCGYTSARAVGSIGCPGCPPAETMPPQNPFYLRAPEGVTSATTLANLQSYVTKAEADGGGWVILTFHGICDDKCTNVNSLSPSIFTAFLDWLAPRRSDGTVVRTVGQVMGTTPSTFTTRRKARTAGQ